MNENEKDISTASAVWYAWGRNDAEGTHTDVIAFGEFYAAQRDTRGQSIQDAYKTFTSLRAYTTWLVRDWWTYLEERAAKRAAKLTRGDR